MASVRIGRTDASSAVEGSREEFVRRGLTLKDLGVDAASGQSFESLNPYTGQAWAMIPDGQEQDVDRAVEAARQALDHPDWKRMPPIHRGHLLRRFADLLQEHAEHLGHVETRDNGELIREMLGGG